jgi:hypothetical protein
MTTTIAAADKLSPKALIIAAEYAAQCAMKTAKTTPMIVTQRANPMDDNSPPVKQWYVPEGPCGFAWVNISPARGPLVAELKKQGKGHKAYHGGWDYWMGSLNHTQSIEVLEAGARAMAAVFKTHGYTAYAQSRLD